MWAILIFVIGFGHCSTEILCYGETCKECDISIRFRDKCAVYLPRYQPTSLSKHYLLILIDSAIISLSRTVKFTTLLVRHARLGFVVKVQSVLECQAPKLERSVRMT